jgi:hypothetical protein
MRCSGCGDCCGPVPCTHEEWLVISNWCAEKGVMPAALVPGQLKCPFMRQGDKAECLVYEVRPLLCRLFGHVEGMVCPRKRQAPMDEATAKAIMAEYVKRRGKTIAQWFADDLYALEAGDLGGKEPQR